MREIKFRGKRISDGQWVFGIPQYDEKGKISIMVCYEPNKMLQPFVDSSLFWYDVVPESVEQFTGLKDKNGKEIYEGDKIRDGWDKKNIGVVEFKDGYFDLRIGYVENIGIQANDCEIVGNIYGKKPEIDNGS